MVKRNEGTMSKINKYAFPQPDGPCNPYNRPTGGLTKRDYFAGMAMQGLVHKIAEYADILREEGLDSQAIVDQLAMDSVRAADALIAELEKESGG